MKSISPNKSNKKTLLFVAVIVALLLVGLATYVYAYNGSIFGWHLRQNPTDTKNPTINYDPASSEQKAAGDQVKSKTLDQRSKNQGSGSGVASPPSPVPQQNGKSTVGVTITAASQNGSTLQVRTVIDTVTITGTCTLTLSNGSKTVTKTADVQSLPTTSTCKGFDVPTSELGTGTWNLTLLFENSTLKGQDTKTVIIH